MLLCLRLGWSWSPQQPAHCPRLQDRCQRGGTGGSREHRLRARDLRRKIQKSFVADRQDFGYLASDHFSRLLISRPRTGDHFPDVCAKCLRPPGLRSEPLYHRDCPGQEPACPARPRSALYPWERHLCVCRDQVMVAMVVMVMLKMIIKPVTTIWLPPVGPSCRR